MQTYIIRSSSSATVPRSISDCNALYLSNPNYKFSSCNTGRVKLSIRCSRGNMPPVGSDSGEHNCKPVLDAFFLGKAFGDTVNERTESTVRDLLGAVDMVQEELKNLVQQQIQDFQKDVLKRAGQGKQKAKREAREAQHSVPKQTTTGISITSVVKSPPSEESTPMDSDGTADEHDD